MSEFLDTVVAMTSQHADHVLYAVLVGTSLALTFFASRATYTAPASHDDFTVLTSYIEYLQEVAMQQDRKLQIIYFGFFVALFFLGYCIGRQQQRIRRLEDMMQQRMTCMEDMMRGVFKGQCSSTSRALTQDELRALRHGDNAAAVWEYVLRRIHLVEDSVESVENRVGMSLLGLENAVGRLQRHRCDDSTESLPSISKKEKGWVSV
jgi:hypothetical protein